jgi:hypothetical protein
MKKLALLAAMTATPAFSQDPDPVFQMIDGIGGCLLGGGKAEITVAELANYGWTGTVDAETGVTHLAPEAGPTTGVVTNEVGYCRIESSALGTDDAEMPFNLFMMGGNSGIEVTEEGTDADGCMTKTLSNGAVATLNSGGQDPVCEGESTSAWTITFAAE